MPAFDAKAIIDGDAAQLTRLLAQLAQIMSVPESTLRSRFIADFFIALAPLHHHDAIRENFSSLENAIASQAADLEQIAMNMAHPLNTSVDIWLTQGLRWYPADSRSSQAFVAKFGELLSSIAACAASSGKQWTSVQSGLDALSGWQANEERRALLSEARLCEVASSEFRALSAECAVLDLFNEQLVNRYLPVALKQGIEGSLKNALQHTVLTAGDTAYQRLPFWQFWQRQLYQLAQIYGATGVILTDQELYQALPAQLEKLEQSLAMQTINPQAYEVWIDELSTCLMNTIQKQPMEYYKFSAMNYPEGAGQTQVTMTPSLFAQFGQVNIGDWFYFRSEEQQPLSQALRCKLAMKHESSGQLLFVDFLGRKILAKTMQDFALCLSTGIALPMEVMSAAKAWQKVKLTWVKRVNQAVQQFQAKAEKAQAEKLAATHQTAQKSAATAQVLGVNTIDEHSLSTEPQENQAHRKSAAVKARAEALAFKQQALEQKAKSAMAAQSIDELQVGAWLEICLEGAEPTRCKLSVIIQSTGKYILVDQLGRKHSELLKADLCNQLASGQVKVLHKGNNFEDQLAKVIQGLRRDVS